MEGVFRFKSWLLNAPGLIHGGAYYWNFTVYNIKVKAILQFVDEILVLKVNRLFLNCGKKQAQMKLFDVDLQWGRLEIIKNVVDCGSSKFVKRHKATISNSNLLDNFIFWMNEWMLCWMLYWHNFIQNVQFSEFSPFVLHMVCIYPVAA